MKTRAWYATLRVLGLLGMGAFGLWQCEAALTAGQGEAMYQGTEPELRVRFTYPDAWPLKEEQGTHEPYRAVRIMAPKDAKDAYTSHITVQGAPMKAQGGRFASAEEWADHYKGHLLAGAQILSQSQKQVGGLNATELVVSYTLPAIHHKGLKPVAVQIKERKLFIADPSHLYAVSYTADLEAYDRYAAAFDRLVESFTFQ